MSIFSDKTIKDPSQALKTISARDVENPAEAVKRNLNNLIIKSIYNLNKKPQNKAHKKIL